MTDSKIYAKRLFPTGNGYPLFNPDPLNDVPDRDRKIGIRIGDVGVVTRDGSFDTIFNITLASNDPSNRFGVPAGYVQVTLRPGDIAERAQCHPPGSDISNTAVKKTRLDMDAGTANNVFSPLEANAVVEVSMNSKQTAVLLLPEGASSLDLRGLQAFRDYALKHAESWYAFVNGDLGRMIGKGDLYLVTGVTKSTSWSVAALENHSGDGKVSMRLKAAQFGGAGTSYTWEWEGSYRSVNSGPRRNPGEETWGANQTVFLRGFKVASRSILLRRPVKVFPIVDSKWSEIKPGNKFVPFSQPNFATSPPNGLPQNVPSTSDNAHAAHEIDYANLYQPTCVTNEHLFDCVPGVTLTDEAFDDADDDKSTASSGTFHYTCYRWAYSTNYL
ncbi:hypothetical protein B0H11DRAFT_830114 [Mycena galericulata]|nr:hypothetical protein B0H11DRAFT_830114 [Mycena galericulata]